MPRKKPIRRGKKNSRKATTRSMSVKRPAKLSGPLVSRRINLVVKNLILFAILFILSVVIASLSASEMMDQLFWILAILTAFVAVALLIVLLIFLFMRAMKK